MTDVTHWHKSVEFSVAIATVYVKSVLGPTTESLFFACPKKRLQKKRHLNTESILRAVRGNKTLLRNISL
jgi:hypothetical protein